MVSPDTYPMVSQVPTLRGARYLPYGEPERVHLAEPLLVGEGGDVLPQALEGLIDTLHSSPVGKIFFFFQKTQLI